MSEAASAAATDVARQTDEPRALPPHDEAVVDVLAAKVLIDWLRNRQQLLVPFRLDLHKLEAHHAELVIQAFAAAALADGPLDQAKRERLDAALAFASASDEQRASLWRAVEHAKPLREVLMGVTDVRTGAIFHAASLLAIDRRKRVNRHYLRYLAARLQLSEDLSRDLERRFSAAV